MRVVCNSITNTSSIVMIHIYDCNVTEMFASQSERLAILEVIRDDRRDSIAKTG